MTAPGQHLFRDEWLLPLVRDYPRISEETIATWRAEQRRFLSQALVDEGICSFDELGQAILGRFRITYDMPSVESLDRKLIPLVPEKACRRHGLLPRHMRDNTLLVLMQNPGDHGARQEVEWATGRRVTPVFCLPDHLERLLLQMLAPDAVVYDMLEHLEVESQVELMASGKEEGEKEIVEQVKAPVIRLVNALISDAIKRRASDIHIEQEEQSTVVRYRIDGHLRRMMVVPRYIGAGPLVSRIKIMADLDLAERRNPQDGRAKLRIEGTEIGLRVSTLPTSRGEKVVLRILDERAAQVPLDALGFHGDVLKRLEALIEREEGIILVTGPTGSGKTTTLYSVLNRRNAEKVNIVTVEDPIEYRLAGINQVQVKERQGLTFASVLRSFLRQDPDIIMVGEIRDAETADIACQAALTGHLVLSTLHTSDTVTAIARLMDMDVERFKIAGGLIGVTAQRLVRKLCPACAGEVEAASLSPLLENMLRQHGLPTVVRQPVGCAACDHSGYRGRFCLVELLEIREELRDLIGSGTGAEKLREAALAAGALHTMKKDILRHLSAGTTSFEEIQTYLELNAGGAEAPSDARVPEPRRPEPAAPATPTPAVPASTPPVAVLVTDDKAVRKTLHEILAEKGFQIAAPPDGQVAVAMVARSNPSLLLVGPPFARTDEAGLIPVVRSVLGMRDLPVMALTESEEEAEGILAAGADEYLVLPLRPGTARKRMESLMRRNEGWSPLEDVMRPITPAGEQKRLKDLRSTGMLDTAEEERFDRLTRKAAEQFEVPISLVSLVDEDRQWFKSHYGLESRQTPRDVSFCGHAVLGEEVFVVEDSYLDPRFSFNPLVTGEPHIRFYAGYPLRGPAGQRIGSFCIVDHKPRTMSATERGALETLGREVEQELGRAADTG